MPAGQGRSAAGVATPLAETKVDADDGTGYDTGQAGGRRGEVSRPMAMPPRAGFVHGGLVPRSPVDQRISQTPAAASETSAAWLAVP